MLRQRALQGLNRAKTCCSCYKTFHRVNAPVKLPHGAIHHASSPVSPQQQPRQQQRKLCISRAEPEQEKPVVYNTEFGYSRKDVLIIIVGLLALGILLYEGLQALGMDAGMAGNWVQLIIFLGICVGWVSTYIWRVATKNMTYAKQLEMYEASVIEKRLDEMTEAEVEQLLKEVEQDKSKGADRRFKRNTQQ